MRKRQPKVTTYVPRPAQDRCYHTGKPMYTKRLACEVANTRMREGSDSLRIYHCERCNFWHLTKH